MTCSSSKVVRHLADGSALLCALLAKATAAQTQGYTERPVPPRTGATRPRPHASAWPASSIPVPPPVYGVVGQSNYGAVRAGIPNMSIVDARELQRYGVTVNAIYPTAMRRLAEDLFKRNGMAAQAAADAFDSFDAPAVRTSFVRGVGDMFTTAAALVLSNQFH